MAAVKSVLDELSETIADAKARREQELARAKEPEKPKETTTIGFGTAPAAPSSSVMMLQPKKKKAQADARRAAGAAAGGERAPGRRRRARRTKGPWRLSAVVEGGLALRRQLAHVQLRTAISDAPSHDAR